MADYTEPAPQGYQPVPGGMVDTARKARAAAHAQAQAGMTASGDAPPAGRPVPVHEEDAQVHASRRIVIAPGAAVLLLPQDANRKRATVQVVPGSAQSVYGQGTVTNPGVFATIATTATLPAGTYTVTATVLLSGTVTAADGNNMQLAAAGASPTGINIIYPGIAGDGATVTVTMTLPGGVPVTVKSPAAASGAAAVYSASITATPATGAATATLSPSESDAQLGTGYPLASGQPWVTTSQGILYAGNPGAANITLAVLMEMYGGS